MQSALTTTEDRPLMDFLQGEVRAIFQQPESPKYSFPLSEAVESLFDLLHLHLGDADLDAVGTQILLALRNYRERNDFINLPDRLEAFLKFMKQLLKAKGSETPVGIPSSERAFLPEVLQALGLANASTVGAQPLDELLGKPRFAWHIARAVQARNQVHRAPIYSAREKAEIFESACVVMIFAVCEFKEKLNLAILASRHRHLLEQYRDNFDKWRERFVDLEGCEHLTEQFEGIDPLAVEIVEDDSAMENGTDGNRGAADDTGDSGVDTTLVDQIPEQRRGLVRDLVRDIPKLVLLGDPGAGKTTTLQYLAWQAATGLLKKPSGERWFPIYIPLKAFASGETRTIEAAVRSVMESTSIKKLANQSCLFLLDGLNEVPQEHLAVAKQEIQSLISLGENMRVVLTCRPGQFQNEFALPVFELQPLRDEYILRFFQKHLRDNEKVRKLLAIVKRQPKLWEWARNPFMLAMLVRVFRRNGKLPENRGRLMQAFVGDIIRREHAQGAARTLLETKTTLLAYLAFETRKLAMLSFTRIEACAWVKQTRDELGSTLDVPLFIDEVLNNNLLAETTGGLLTFDHELYQEYFCAVALVEMGAKGTALIADLQQEPRWEEPIVLFSGISDHRGSILRSLAGTNVYLAARCLTSSSVSETTDREFILQQAKVLASTAGDPAKVAQGLLSFAELGEAEAMIAVLKQRGSQDAIAQRAINAFVPKCSPELVVDWIQKTSDYSDKFLIRWLLAAIAPDQKEILLRDHREAFRGLLMGQFRGARLDKHAERTHLRRLLSFLGDEVRKWMLVSIAREILSSEDHSGSEDQWQAFIRLWSGKSDLPDPTISPALLAPALNRAGRFSLDAAALIWSNHLAGHDLAFLLETLGEEALSRAMRFLRRIKGLERHRLSLSLSNILRGNRALRFGLDPTLLRTTTARLERLASIRIGEVRKTCTVKAVKKFGSFVELEPGLDGFLHPLDMMWGASPTDRPVLDLKQVVDVVVLEVDDARGTVLVGLKQMIFVPWENAESRYSVGAKVKAKVLIVGNENALVQLEPGVQGIIARKDLSWDAYDKPADLLVVGSDTEAIVLGADRESLFFSLSTRLLQVDPWEEVDRSYPIGSIAVGKVLNLVDFGAFVRLAPGIHALLHITDMSWGKVKHPSSLLCVGQDLEVVILAVQKDKKRISLGLKQRFQSPWETVELRYPAGLKIKGRVANLVPYGAFIELEPGVEGLVHITELSWTKRDFTPSDILNPDQEIEVIVLSTDREKEKISLSLRQLQQNPWSWAAAKYAVGARIKGKVSNIVSYGAFVELEEDFDGMVHVSDFSWTRKMDHPSEVLKKGDEVEVVVLEVDQASQRIALGLKQLIDDPWRHIERYCALGDLVRGKVNKFAGQEVFIDLPHDLCALLHISHVAESSASDEEKPLAIGQEITARITVIDKDQRRIGLVTDLPAASA